MFGRVGVFLGGRSRERAISIRSGKAVCQALKNKGFEVVMIDPARGLASQLRRRKPDMAFIALHGEGGEDGAIQKILEGYGIPYVGSPPQASLLAFDKALAKAAFLRCGIPTPAYSIVHRKNWREEVSRWEPPYVVKPLREGSSIGIVMIERRGPEAGKIKPLLAEYRRLLIEKKIEGREYTVGILGRQALPVIEVRPRRPFYDFRAKYTKGLTEYLVPAPVSRTLGAQLEALALGVHQGLGLRDLSRVDFKVSEDGKPYVLEVNSIPGFTETSLLPKAAECAGINFETLCVRLLDSAWQRSQFQEPASSLEREKNRFEERAVRTPRALGPHGTKDETEDISGPVLEGVGGRGQNRS